METRHTQFEKSGFNKQWKELMPLLQNFKKSGFDNDDIIKFERMKKVLFHIDTHLSIADWDLLTKSEFDRIFVHENVINYIIKCLIGEIPLHDHFPKIGNILDNNLIPILRNLILQETVPKKKDLKSIYDSYNQILEQINPNEVKTKKDEIDNYYSELFIDDDEENKSIKSNIGITFKHICENYKIIKYLHDELLEGTDGTEPVLQQIQTKKTEILSEIENIQRIIVESSNRQDELNKFYNQVFGDFNQETESREGGLKQQFDNDVEEFKNYKEEQKKDIKEVKNEIKFHLGDAISISLSGVFRSEANKFKWILIFWTGAFILAVAAIVGLVSDLYFDSDAGQIKTLADQVNFLLWKIPATLPLIWIATFCARRRSETDRLYHEYLHKEVVANSFSKYEQQLEKLDEGDEKCRLLNKLLESTIEAIGKNPIDALGKKIVMIRL